MAIALCGHLDGLEASYKSLAQISVATGYFNAEGFAVIADRLEKLTRVRLLLGAEPISPAVRPVRAPGDPSGSRFEEKLVRDGLEKNTAGMLRDRYLLEFDAATERVVCRLIGFLDSDVTGVKR